jgi:SAM-dependent methyltransferase
MAITPIAYARWRESPLGALTEPVEQEAVFALTGCLAGLHVLDAGCGDGTYAIRAAQLGARVTAIDYSRAMLDAARRRAEVAGVCVNWCGGRAEALPLQTASFDLVIAVTVLCGVSDPADAVREMARVVRPGGAVVIGELGRYNLWAFFRRVRGWLGARFWRAAHFWTVGELRSLAESAGLQFCRASSAVYYPPSRILAKWLAPFDRPLSTITSTGAAFLCVRAGKPPVTGQRKGTNSAANCESRSSRFRQSRGRVKAPTRTPAARAR